MKGSSSFDGKLTVCKQKQLQANGTLQSALLGVQGGPRHPRMMGRGDDAAGGLRRQNKQC